MFPSRRGLVLVLALGAVCAASAGAGVRAKVPGRIVFAADRLPVWYGEIYRVGLDGQRVDLSESPAQDVGPAVSPDGKLVAFASNRGGRVGLYTVAIDGTHLERVSPLFLSHENSLGVQASVAWSRDGRQLAAALSGYGGAAAFWVGDLSGRGRVVRTEPVLDPVWAPDGHVLAYEPGDNEVDVIAPSGKPLWHVLGDANFAAWSRQGRLAVRFHGETIRLYSERGRSLGSFPGEQFAWSPDRTQLASLHGRWLQVRSRGLGRPTVNVRLLPNATGGIIEWLGNHRLRAFTGSAWFGFDVAAKKRLALPQPFAAFHFPPAVSNDGSELAITSYAGAGRPVTLNVATLSGAFGPVLQSAPNCGDDLPYSSLQFTPDGSALVYQSGCPVPSADIYSVAGDGSDVRQLTDSSTDETQPSVSPDATQIAFVQQLIADRCKGCPNTIWQMSADGTNQRELTAPAPNFDAWDGHPSWSPDGKSILFGHSTINSSGYLVEIPAGGGRQRRLTVPGGYPAWGPTRIAYITSKGAVQTALPDGSDATTVTANPNVLPQTLAWSSDGRLAFLEARSNGTLRLVIANGTTLTRRLLGSLESPVRTGGLTWSPDGTQLAFTANDTSNVSDIYTVSADGTNLQQLTHALDAIGPLSWTNH